MSDICPQCQFDRRGVFLSLPSCKCQFCGIDFTVWQYSELGTKVLFCPYCGREKINDEVEI